MKNAPRCFIAIPLTLLTVGCLTSEEPFIGAAEHVVQDDALPGMYRFHPAEAGSGYWVVARGMEDPHYRITYVVDDACFMHFVGMLFQAGTNRFVNMTPSLKACDSHHPETGPSIMDHLHSLTLKPLHMVVKVCSTTNGPGFSLMTQESFAEARRQAPDVWAPRLPTVPVPRMISDSARQHEFLVKHGGDTNIFPTPQVVKFDPPVGLRPPHDVLAPKALEQMLKQRDIESMDTEEKE
jgi:hypothetical protein